MKLLIKTAARNIFRNARRSLMTGSAVAAGALAMVLFGGFVSYIFTQLETSNVQRIGEAAKRVRAASDERWCADPGFATACRVDDLIYVGAVGAPEEGSLDGQLQRSLQRMQSSLHEVGSSMDDVAKLNVLFATTDAGEDADYRTLQALLIQQLPTPGPVVTLVRVAGLPQNGQRVQVDGVAVTPSR